MVARKAWDDKRDEKVRTLFGREPRPHPFQARKVDLGDCPAGYDPDVWDMALLFEQRATDRGTRLTVGRIILYAMLEPRMEWLRDQRAQVNEKIRGSWSADGVTRFSSWQEMGRAAIELFWRDDGDLLEPNDPGQYAADDFCHPLEFKAIVWEVRRKSVNKHSRENA